MKNRIPSFDEVLNEKSDLQLSAMKDAKDFGKILAYIEKVVKSSKNTSQFNNSINWVYDILMNGSVRHYLAKNDVLLVNKKQYDDFVEEYIEELKYWYSV